MKFLLVIFMLIVYNILPICNREKSPCLVVLEELDGLVLLEKLATLEMLEEY